MPATGNPSASPDPLLAGVKSLRDRNARAAILRELTARASLPAPVAAERIRGVLDAETAFERLIRHDSPWYFEHLDEAEAIEFARDMQVLHTAAARAMDALVKRSGEWSRSDDLPTLQRLVGLSAHHMGAAIKWCFLRHETLRPDVWPPMHALYQYAEQAGFSTYPMRLFDDEGAPRTTVQALYLRALLLDLINRGNLSSAQIESGDGWLAEWATAYALDRQYRRDIHPLMVDLAGNAGLQIAADAGDDSTHRFLRVDGLREQIDTVRDELRAGRSFRGGSAANVLSVEPQVGLLAAIERVYQTLLQANAAKLEQRTLVADLRADVRLGFAAARLAVAGEAEVVPAAAAPAAMKFGGIELTLEHIPGAGDAEASTTASSNLAGAPHWKIQDMSSRGIGLLVSPQRGEQIVVGELIAIKPEGFDHWLMGAVVRKISQRAENNILLGIEIFCYRPLPVLLARFAHTVDAEPDPTLAPIAALYLPGQEADGTGDILLLPAGDFGLKTTFSLATRAARFRVRINRVMRKGNDWIGLRFEVIARKDWPAADSRTHR